jgi:hypothetical protein
MYDPEAENRPWKGLVKVTVSPTWNLYSLTASILGRRSELIGRDFTEAARPGCFADVFVFRRNDMESAAPDARRRHPPAQVTAWFADHGAREDADARRIDPAAAASAPASAGELNDQSHYPP